MWKSVTYAVQGRGHIKKDIPCQDKVFYMYQNGVDCIALADGAGSAKYSHWGAEVVVKEVCRIIVENMDSLVNESDAAAVKERILDCLTEMLLSKADELDCGIKDLASTLLFAAVKDDAVFIGHLGDGLIAGLKDNQVKIISCPDNGEFANSTYFVTSQNAVKKMRIMKGNARAFNGFILMSDGSSASFYDKREKNISDGVKRLLDWFCIIDEEHMYDIVKESFDEIIVNNTIDDCSIAIMSRQCPPSAAEGFDYEESLDFFVISPKERNPSKRIRRYIAIMKLYAEGKSLKQIAKEIGLKPKYTKRKLAELKRLGILGK